LLNIVFYISNNFPPSVTPFFVSLARILFYRVLLPEFVYYVVYYGQYV